MTELDFQSPDGPRDFSWTVGDDATLSHRRMIDAGASGEVHEILDSDTGQVFARKLIHPIGGLAWESIKNEVRAVAKLCKPGTNKNIVSVFRHGTLTASHFYFLDMELCELNLEHYIERKWTPLITAKVPYFTNEQPTRMRTSQIWDIMEDISSGVGFIHLQNEIHRDLKPRNVLYSHKEEAWKIGDFGLTVEGTSQKAHTTQYSRGTCSYRAPELVQYVENRTYTNKVDIWAMGCILYELVFHKKAFPNDHAVYLYSLEYPNSGATLDIPVMSDIINDKARMAFVSRILSEMLDVSVRTRPRADSICKRFIAWAVQSPQLPSFVEMTNIDLEHSATNPEGQIVIELSSPPLGALDDPRTLDGEVHESDTPDSANESNRRRRIDTTDQDLPAELDSPGSLPGQLIAYWKMRAKFKPQDYATVKSLVNAFTDSGLYDEASAYWTEVARVDNSSPIRDLSLFGDLLVDAFLEDGQTEKAMEIWRFQFKMQTDNFSLPSGLRKNVALRCEAINACKSRLREDPGDFEAAESLQGLWEEYQENEETRFGFWKGILRIGGECNHVVIHEVRDCFTQMGDLKSEVQFWKALVLDYPDAEMLFNQLDRALTEQGDDMACFSFWGKMVRRHPRVVHIAYYFVEAARFVNMEAAVNTWKNWLEYFLSGQAVYSRIECCRQGGFTIRSIVACLDRAFDDHSQAIEFWEESLRKYPDWPPPKLQRWHGCLEADPRREAMARVLLACSYEEETDQSIRTLERAAKICPTYDEVSAAFFEACKKIDNLQIYFECWNALASSDFSTIANLRLVQYHLQMRSEYTDILNYLCRINTEKLMYKHRDVLMKGVNQWLLGSDVRGAYCFWLDVVTANCSVSYVECLIEASKASKETEKALDVLKELFLKDPNNLALGQCLENAFRANRVTPSDLETEILFWKDAVRQQLAKNEPINNICSVLSSAFKFQGVDSYPTSTVDEREACQQKVVGFWKSIVEESMGNLQNVVDELELAFKSRVLALEDNLPRLGEVWTEAIEFWEEMLLRSPQSQLLKTKLKTARDLASCLGFILDK